MPSGERGGSLVMGRTALSSGRSASTLVSSAVPRSAVRTSIPFSSPRPSKAWMPQRARRSRTRAPRLDDTFLMYGVLGNRPSSSADGRGLTGDQVHETRGEAQTLGRLIVTEAMVRRSGNGTMEPADCRAEPPRARSARCDPEQGASAGWRRRAAPSPRHPKSPTRKELSGFSWLWFCPVARLNGATHALD